MSISDRLSLLLLIGQGMVFILPTKSFSVTFRGLESADLELIPVNDTRIVFFYGSSYKDRAAYTLYEADKLAQDPKFQGNYTTLFVPDLFLIQYSVVHPVAEAYLTLPDVNFLKIDWGYKASDASDVKLPDQDKLQSLLSDFIIELLKYVDGKTFHLLSLSTGVPLAGNVTKEYFDKTGLKLPRLTALDPPTIRKAIVRRLRGIYNQSVEFADCIHTAPFKQGSIMSIGHADFWPNGATEMQPGCTEESDKGPEGCSHVRAVQLYIESVRNRDSGPQFCSYGMLNFINLFQRKTLGKPVIMGINCDPSARGDYFLVTKDKSPYTLDWCPM